MIELKNIKRNDDVITCNAYVENCKESIDLVYNIKNDELSDFRFPDNYEYCTSHIAKAKRYFKKVALGEEIFLKHKVIMWY